MQRKIFFILTNILIIILAFGLISFSYFDLPPEVPMWYSRPWGEGQLAPKIFLFLIPAFSLIFLIFNLIFPKILKIENSEENARKIAFINESFIFVSFVVSLINLVTVIKIVGLFL